MTRNAQDLPTHARIFVAAVVLCGSLAIGASAYELIQNPQPADWLLLAGLTLLTGSFSIKLPAVSARISVSESFVLASVLLFGPAVATMIAALDTLIVTSWTRRHQRSPIRILFNMSAGATAVWISASAFHFAVRISLPEAALDQLLAPVFLLALSYFAINSSLVAVAIGLETHSSPAQLWKNNFAWLSLNYLAGASVALLLFNYTKDIDLTALSVIVPLLVIIYLTFRTSLGRVEDANRHVAQLNELYLSTVETLAMAVDAKDQITHGHIRRVQVYAVELAKHLGVTEPQQLKAIEAAALLHDMGKLAIPEHILNKPGKLSTAEFQQMQRHSDIGADLLSSIRFPYPVVPIVRHHHEQWDGNGYPAGIAGADIPLGARILSVVDCFDALTSDRPYRPRMTIEEAQRILCDRRGSMYDPLVVDAFVNIYPTIAETARLAGEQARSLTANAADHPYPSLQALDEIRVSAIESAKMQEARRRLTDVSIESDAFAIVAQYARELTPSTSCVYFHYDQESDSLECVLAAGENSTALLGFRVRVGERVSGWVAANNKTASNANPQLELSASAQLLRHPKSTLSTPVHRGRGSAVIHGVLTAFSPAENAFTHQHVYAFEQLAAAYSERFKPERSNLPKAVPFSRRQNRNSIE